MPEQQSLIFRSHFTATPIPLKGYDLAAPNHALPRQAGIYLIIHDAGGKLYVGSAVDLCRRHGEHQRMFRRGAHENDHLQKAWNKHGQGAFSFVVLFYCSPADLLFYEQRAIDHYKALVGWRAMFNQNPSASSPQGRPMSAKAHALLLERLKGNTYTLGYKHSPETKAKLAASTRAYNLGRGPTSAATKAKIGNANRGRKHSAEARAKISTSLRAKKKPTHCKNGHLYPEDAGSPRHCVPCRQAYLPIARARQQDRRNGPERDAILKEERERARRRREGTGR